MKNVSDSTKSSLRHFNIHVGSANPIKVAAVKMAAANLAHSATWSDVDVVGIEVASGVSAQPLSDQETKQGALYRSHQALNALLLKLKKPSVEFLHQDLEKSRSALPMLGVGLEGGVFTENRQVWSTVWVSVCDSTGFYTLSNGARFMLPEVLAKRVASGQELGPLMTQITSIENISKKQGMIGVLTTMFVDRSSSYASIAQLAIGLWYGRFWEDELL